MKRTKLLSVLACLAFSLGAEAKVDSKVASKIAKAYALGLDRSIESNLDGETLDEALSDAQVIGARFSFMLQDVSGDCGLEISVRIADGNLDLNHTAKSWQCH